MGGLFWNMSRRIIIKVFHFIRLKEIMAQPYTPFSWKQENDMLKEEARKIYKQKRKELPDAERSKRDDLLLIQFQTVELPFIHHLLSYWPIEENQEPNTHLFNDYIEFRNPAVKILYPKSDFEKTEIEAVEVNADTAFEKTPRNIYEPMDGTVTDSGLIDMAFVPL